MQYIDQHSRFLLVSFLCCAKRNVESILQKYFQKVFWKYYFILYFENTFVKYFILLFFKILFLHYFIFYFENTFEKYFAHHCWLPADVPAATSRRAVDRRLLCPRGPVCKDGMCSRRWAGRFALQMTDRGRATRSVGKVRTSCFWPGSESRHGAPSTRECHVKFTLSRLTPPWNNLFVVESSRTETAIIIVRCWKLVGWSFRVPHVVKLWLTFCPSPVSMEFPLARTTTSHYLCHYFALNLFRHFEFSILSVLALKNCEQCKIYTRSSIGLGIVTYNI